MGQKVVGMFRPQKWKSTEPLTLPLAFRVTTHLEAPLFCALSPRSPQPVQACPSQPGPSPKGPRAAEHPGASGH